MRTVIGIPFLFIFAIAPISLGQEAAKKTVECVLTGRVERVYATKKRSLDDKSDSLFAIELVVQTASNSDQKILGTTVFVKTWRLSGPTAASEGTDGQVEIPVRGDLIECDVTGGPNTFDALVPDGIRIVFRGSTKSRSTGLELTLVDKGEFLMGSQGNEQRQADELPHRVRITKPFYLGIHEVTQAEYSRVMSMKPSSFSFSGSSKDKVVKKVTDRFPVDSVTWFDAIQFCNLLSKREGYQPYYELSDLKIESGRIVSATTEIVGGIGYRLPSEAEWEYACRTGSRTAFHYGNESTEATGNIKAMPATGGYGAKAKWENLGRTTNVGSYPCNDWGLFDMHGNVAEWCEDWYEKDYQTDPANADNLIEDPRGPSRGTHKVMRGGSWMVNEGMCRSASRFYHIPSEAKFYGGFRVARTPQ